MKFSNRLEQLSEGNDQRAIANEQIFIRRKIDELNNEINQLENNIGFFNNAKGNNPFIKEVQKNIEKHKEELQTWKDKLKKLNTI
jgi:dynactin complex subunit